jgi:plasmid stabilization system protein ParE
VRPSRIFRATTFHHDWNPQAFSVLNEHFQSKEDPMPRGDKSSYTEKQKRQAEHIEEGYEHRGVSEKEAERRAWATVNKETHGGKKSGSGRGTEEDHSPSRKGGRLGGAASAERPAADRSRSAKKAAQTRKRCAA